MNDKLNYLDAVDLCLQYNVSMAIGVVEAYTDPNLDIKPMNYFVGDFDPELFQDLYAIHGDAIFHHLGNVFIKDLKDKVQESYSLTDKPFKVTFKNTTTEGN